MWHIELGSSLPCDECHQPLEVKSSPVFAVVRARSGGKSITTSSTSFEAYWLLIPHMYHALLLFPAERRCRWRREARECLSCSLFQPHHCCGLIHLTLKMLLACIVLLAFFGAEAATRATQSVTGFKAAGKSDAANPRRPCFPALDFKTPQHLPLDSQLVHWWCDDATEYAFMGFSYEVTACQSREQLRREFRDIREHFRSRYVRLYGACDREGFYDDIVEAAWENTLGIHALIWFGFNLDDIWIGRRDTLLAALHANPKAKFVTRVLQFGSEPLFDDVLPHQELTRQVEAAKANLSSLHIPVTVSELAFGYQERGGAQELLDALDSINIHMLPFFSQHASTANNAWPLVLNDLQWFIDHGKGKKMYFDENGWPSVTSEGVQPNSPDAVADIQNERDYYVLLDNHCQDLKAVVGGGVGWFAHIYSDNQEPGYGIYNSSGHLKFPFHPRTFC